MVTSRVATTEYTSFDILGRVTGHKQTTDSHDYTTSYTYNLSGALIDETYPSGRVVENTLDTEGNLSQVQTHRSGDTFRNYANGFRYSPAGAVTAMRLGNGKWESTAFNSRLQPTQIALGGSAGDSGTLKLDYTYGTTANNGNILTQTITVPGMTYPLIQTYTYDSLNRIHDAVETSNSVDTWKQTFTDDRYGNRNFDEANTTTLPKLCGTSPSFTVCTADQKKLNPSVDTSTNRLNTSDNYAFDVAGNTTGDALGRTFVYDGENKQVAVTETGGTIGEYSYDGDGKRIKKRAYTAHVLTEEITFVYDAAGKQIAEYTQDIANSTDAKVAYLTNDHLGSPRINTDVYGNIISRHDYHPFGEEIATAGRTGPLGYQDDTVRKQFTGKERDIEVGLDYFSARYYSPSFARFTSPDEFKAGPEELFGKVDPHSPLFYAETAEPQSLNKYQYCLDNPLRFIDPDGHQSKTADALKNGASNLQVNNISVFSGKFPELAGSGNAGKQAVNPNGTSAGQPWGFNLSIDYTLTKNKKPVSGAKIVEDVKIEFESIVSEGGNLGMQKDTQGFSGDVSNKPTDKNGKFTDAPVGANNDNPFVSVKITQNLFSVDAKGNKTKLETNTISAATDIRIVDNKLRGTGKTTVKFSNSTFEQTLVLPRPDKIE